LSNILGDGFERNDIKRTVIGEMRKAHPFVLSNGWKTTKVYLRG
jgi:hypothetical protein